MDTVKEFLAQSSDMQKVAELIITECAENASNVLEWIDIYRADIQGIFVMHGESDECIRLALGFPNNQGVLHLSEGVQLWKREQLSYEELLRYLVKFSREKYSGIGDAMHPYSKNYRQTERVYVENGFEIDRDPAFWVAAMAKQNGQEILPAESTPQAIRDTYFYLDITL